MEKAAEFMLRPFHDRSQRQNALHVLLIDAMRYAAVPPPAVQDATTEDSLSVALIREALDIGLDLAVETAADTHRAYAGYKPEKHAAVDRDVATIQRAIEALKAATP